MKMIKEQIAYYEQKLKFEMDSWDLFESINKREKRVVLDARLFEAFEQEHIPGAINVPHREMPINGGQNGERWLENHLWLLSSLRLINTLVKKNRCSFF